MLHPARAAALPWYAHSTPLRHSPGSSHVLLPPLDPRPGTQVGLKLYVANAGDCRAVLCRGGQAVRLSHDHKPNLANERARIEAVGGIVHQVRVRV